MQVYVYKITRVDDLSYIGMTLNTVSRFKTHKKSNRFKVGIKSIEILEECDSYETAEDLEEYYIDYFDTFKNGLNVTPNGKGKNEDAKFNTLGHVFSVASRNKMSKAAKARGPNNTGYKHTEETKIMWSLKRKGRPAHNKKISNEIIEEMIASYKTDTLNLRSNYQYITEFVKKSQRSQVVFVQLENLKSPNGKPLSLATLYAKYYSEKYQYSASLIREYLTGERNRC